MGWTRFQWLDILLKKKVKKMRISLKCTYTSRISHPNFLMISSAVVGSTFRV